MTSRRFSWVADTVIVLLFVAIIYGLILFAQAWETDFESPIPIDLSLRKLPYYTLLSGMRGLAAYFFSLCFTLVFGYWAAHSTRAERMIIPVVDILQSIPVLGFLPGFVLGLVALFPKNHVGLELAAILMIFTSQAWNLVLSYYSSLKSLPETYHEVARVVGLTPFQKWFKIELPFSGLPLAWNSLLSMAGGWFFLIPCEAIVLGDKTFQLPGIGSYMFVAMQADNYTAIGFSIVAMVILILLMDFLIWKPLLIWSQRFRLDPVDLDDSNQVGGMHESLMQIWIQKSYLLIAVSTFFRELFYFRKRRKRHQNYFWKQGLERNLFIRRVSPFFLSLFRCSLWVLKKIEFFLKTSFGRWFLLCFFATGLSVLFFFLAKALWKVPGWQWFKVFQDALWTFLRVLLTVVVSTLWTLPVGIWIATSPRRVRLFQPVIQLLASFPSPMLYPFLLFIFYRIGIPLGVSSFFLMILGVQWYLLFNVLAGALRIPQDLRSVLNLIHVSPWERWKVLYIPSIFPSLAAGWITAVGAAWNTSVLAEYVQLRGSTFSTPGLGSDLSLALAHEDVNLFVASLTVMIVVVVTLNRVVWFRVFDLVQSRFRMEV